MLLATMQIVGNTCLYHGCGEPHCDGSHTRVARIQARPRFVPSSSIAKPASLSIPRQSATPAGFSRWLPDGRRTGMPRPAPLASPPNLSPSLVSPSWLLAWPFRSDRPGGAAAMRHPAGPEAILRMPPSRRRCRRNRCRQPRVGRVHGLDPARSGHGDDGDDE